MKNIIKFSLISLFFIGLVIFWTYCAFKEITKDPLLLVFTGLCAGASLFVCVISIKHLVKSIHIYIHYTKL